jgi:hypothetical protein
MKSSLPARFIDSCSGVLDCPQWTWRRLSFLFALQVVASAMPIPAILMMHSEVVNQGSGDESRLIFVDNYAPFATE